MSEETPGARGGLWVPLVAAGLAFVVFLPALKGDFVYDDHRFYEANAALQRPSVLWRAFADPSVQTADDTFAGLWRPLRTLLFAAEQLVFGTRAWGAHLVSLLLHAVGTGLIAQLLRRFGAAPLPALAGAALYALHPAQVECVAWISSQGDLLSAALLWGALLLDARGSRGAAVAAGACALLAKEQAVIWAPLVVVAALLVGATLRSALRRAAVPAVMTLLFVALRHLLLAEPFQEGGVAGGRAAVSELGGMLAHQAWFMALPVGGVFDWQMPWPPATLLGGLLIAALATAAVAQLLVRGSRLPVAWFLVALAPTLFVQALVPLNIRTADRFLLFALPALAVATALAATRRRVVLAPLALAAACFGTLCLQATPVWAGDQALWSATVQRLPGHWRAEFWLGSGLTESDPRRAVEHLERATTAAPDDSKTRFALARALDAHVQDLFGGEQVAMLRRARDEYAAASNRALAPRQENGPVTYALALLRATDLTLALGERDAALRVAERLCDGPRPTLPDWSRPLWNEWLEQFAEHVGTHLDPGLTSPLAPRLRQWGRAP